MSEKEKLSLNIAPVGIFDNIVFGRKSAWAYYYISSYPFDFLSTEAKVRFCQETQSALSSVCSSTLNSTECHLFITNTVFNIDSWEEQMYNAVRTQKNNKVFRNFVNDVCDELAELKYYKRITLLGVELFKRGSFSFEAFKDMDFNMKAIKDTFRKASSQLLKVNMEEITVEEKKRAKAQEEELFRTLSSTILKTRRPRGEELLLIIKKQMYPGMPVPYLEADYENRLDTSDIIQELGGILRVRPRMLEFTQEFQGQDFTGYSACLSFSKIPKDVVMPSAVRPIFQHEEILPFSVNVRFKLIPTEAMRKKYQKQKDETQDEIDNLIESGQSAPTSLKNTLEDLNLLDENLTDEQLPWIDSTYHLMITAPTEELLRDAVSEIKESYQKDEFVLTWTTGDQLQLWQQSILGSERTCYSFSTHTNLAFLGISGFNFGGVVGDPILQKPPLHKSKRG